MFGSLRATRNLRPQVRHQHYNYESVHDLHPAQLRYSKKNVNEVVQKMLDSGIAQKNKNNTYTYKYENGTSLFPPTKLFPVVRAPFGKVLIDGHHDVITSLHLKAPMVPVEIVGDLSHLDTKSFWEEAERRKWAYLFGLDQEKGIPPKSFTDLVDDPNRYFASITARRYRSVGNGIFTSHGSSYPLWLKINKDIPFIEFRIADALSKHGFIYNAEQFGNSPTIEMVEEARIILVSSNIKGLRVPHVRTHYSEINMNKIEQSTNIRLARRPAA